MNFKCNESNMVLSIRFPFHQKELQMAVWWRWPHPILTYHNWTYVIFRAKYLCHTAYTPAVLKQFKGVRNFFKRSFYLMFLIGWGTILRQLCYCGYNFGIIFTRGYNFSNVFDLGVRQYQKVENRRSSMLPLGLTCVVVVVVVVAVDPESAGRRRNRDARRRRRKSADVVLQTRRVHFRTI